MLNSILGSELTLVSFLICTAVSLLLGIGTALVSMYRSRTTQSFAVTLAILPAVVQLVILLVNGTEWLAISVIGGESAPPRVGQPFIPAASEDPHIFSPNTRWRKLEDRFILASGLHSRGTTGGEESHLLTEAEMPEHSHFFKQHNNDGSDTAWIGSVEKRLFRWSTENIMSAGSSQAHNNMPPYEVFDIWIRFE